MRGASLVITADRAIRARLERAAAAAQVRTDHVTSLVGFGGWLRAPAVLIGAAEVVDVAHLRPPRRPHVYVIGTDPLTEDQWAACVALGVLRVIAADEADHAVVEVLADAADGAVKSGEGLVIGVMGACGGAGSSVFAAATARIAARRGPVVLCDLAPSGAGLEVLLGMEASSGACWQDIDADRGRVDAAALLRALPQIPGMRAGTVLLGYGAGGPYPVDGAVVAAVLDAVRRSGGSVVADLPAAITGPVERVVMRADGTVLVIPAEVRGCYGAARLVAPLMELGATVSGVVRGPSPGGLGAADIARAIGMPVVAAMRPQRGLARAIDGGAGLGSGMRGPLYRAAERAVSSIAAAVDRRNGGPE